MATNPSPPSTGGQGRLWESRSVAVDVTVGQAFDLRVGQTAHVVRASLAIRVEAVLEDSRCPVDTTCVWEGDAVFRIRVEEADGEGVTLELHTNPTFAQQGAFKGFRVRLVRVEPPRRDGSAVAAEEYVLTLVVSRS